MEQYIDKSAIKAEIEKYISNYKGLLNKVDKSSDDWVESTLMLESKLDILQHILSFMDSLEVKEVEDNKCKDCTNSKGCINCEDGNMHEVKKKKPEGALKELLDNIDTLEYEKTRREMKEYTPNEDFEAFAKAYMEENDANIVSFYDRYAGLVDGVRWQKVSLWKDAQGDDLPEIDREVIVLYQIYPLENNEYSVGFGHRPKEYWDGKNIDTGEVTRYYPKRYDKGGWNSPNIKWWLDLGLPKKEE